jgi:hypothetical protein
MPGVACPPGGRLGLASPPTPVLGAAKTATLAVAGRCAGRSLPNTLPASSRAWCPARARGLVEAPPTTPGLLVTRSPTPGIFTRRPVALPSSRVTPVRTCPALSPRWCPQLLPFRVWDCGLPTTGNRRRSPPDRLEGYPAVHDDTHFGAPSRGLQARSLQLRTPMAGCARGGRYRLAG